MTAEAAKDLAAAEQELRAAGGPKATTVEGYLMTFDRFARWCIVNDLDSLPASELTVLRYLHAHHPQWGFAHARRQRTAIDYVHVSRGELAPCSALTKRYLAVLRQHDKPPQQKVAALRVQEAAAITTATAELPTDPTVARLRALLVVARAAQLGPGRRGVRQAAVSPPGIRALQALPGDSFDVTDVDIRVDLDRGDDSEPSGVLLVDRDCEPLLYEVLRNALTVPGGPMTHPLRPVGGVEGDVARDSQLIGYAWRRAGLPAQGLPRGLQELSDAQFVRLLAQVDPEHSRRIRNHCYVTMGLFTALRHINLAAFEPSHVRVSADGGYEVDVHDVKNQRPGVVLTKAVGHATADPAQCRHPLCPACALRAQLEIVRECQQRSAGPVLATRYGGEWRAMTSANGRYLLKGLWELAQLDEDARVGTRALRAGGATSTTEAGWEIWDVAENVTNHQDLTVCQLYIRQQDPFSAQYQLAF